MKGRDSMPSKTPILIATLLIALRGVILPFWDCASFWEVVERMMHLSETEWQGVLFQCVFIWLAAEEIVRGAKRKRRKGDQEAHGLGVKW
jgi:hypothetical protein